MLKVEDIADIRPSELVDRLIIVSDHAQISVFSCKQPDEPELNCIRILILIYHDVSEPLLIVLQHIRLRLQKLHGLYKKVVKIQRVVRLELRLVLPIYLRDLLFCEIPSRVQLKLFRKDHLILRRRNRREKRSFLIYFCINIRLPADLLHQGLLIVRIIDGKTVVIPEPVDEPP